MFKNKLIADFLDDYSNRLLNDGSNDYSLENNEENYNFIKEMLLWNSDKDNLEPRIYNNKIDTDNYLICRYLRYLILKDVK